MTLQENNKGDETGSCLMLLIVIWSFARGSADVEYQITVFLDFQMTFLMFSAIH